MEAFKVDKADRCFGTNRIAAAGDQV